MISASSRCRHLPIRFQLSYGSHMVPSECRAKAAEIRSIVREQPDFAETAERIAREWERVADQLEASGETANHHGVHPTTPHGRHL